MDKKHLILLFLITFLFTLSACSKSEINTVAPYSFIDLGDVREIKGGWKWDNSFNNKYQSVAIYCYKNHGVCIESHAELILDGHLFVESILWEIQSWGEVIVATSEEFLHSFLYINRQNKEVIVFEKSKSDNPLDISNINDLTVLKKLQEVFYSVEK